MTAAKGLRYGTMDSRALEFLHESNAIAGIHDIDYRREENARPGAGHVGAFLDSQERAKGQTLPTLEDVVRWQGMLTEEQIAFGHDVPHIASNVAQVPTLLAELFQDLHVRFGSHPLFVDRVALLGDVFQGFQASHPFVDGNGRTGRLLLNHLMTLMDQPLIVFRADERPAFDAAHSSKMGMRRFLAEKIREVVHLDGKLWLRKERYDFADRYVEPESGREFVLEWHVLLEAAESWR